MQLTDCSVRLRMWLLYCLEGAGQTTSLAQHHINYVFYSDQRGFCEAHAVLGIS